MKRSSLLQFETSEKQLRLSSANIPQTLNEIGKTILNFDITDNVNRIQKRRVEQRREDQTKYQKEQEDILKKKLIKQNDAQIIIENMKKNEEIKEDFKVDVSSLYSSMKEQFPLFNQNNDQNQWQSIAKTIISPQSAQVSPDNSLFIELNSKRRSLFSNYNANILEKSFDSTNNIASVKQRVSFLENVKTKEKENKPSFEFDQKQWFFSHVISSNYIESALKNKTQNQIKFRRIKLGSLEKEVKFDIIENQQDNRQLIQRNRFVPKIFLDKQIILFENSQQKIPSYHPQIQKNKKAFNLNILNTKVPTSRRQSLIFYSSKDIQNQAQIEKQYKKLIQFRSENTLEYQRAQNTLLFDLIFDNIQANNVKKSKHGKSQQRTPKVNQAKQSDDNDFKTILKNVTRDNIRRKSCHCSECGDITQKQKLSQMVLLDKEKKSPVKIHSQQRQNKKNYTANCDSPNNYIRLANQNKNFSMLSHFQPEKISSQQQTQLSINSKQSNETPKQEAMNNQDEFSCMIQSQNKALKRQNSLGLVKVQNLDQSRYRTDTQDTDRYQEEMSESQQLKFRANKQFNLCITQEIYQIIMKQNRSFFIKIEALKKSQQALRDRVKENNQILKSYSPSKLKLKLILKNEDKNCVLAKFLNERQKSSRRIEEYSRRQVVSQQGQRNIYNQPQFSNNSEKQEYLKQANKIFFKNTKKNLFLKQLDEKSDNINKILGSQNIQTCRVSTADPYTLRKNYKKNDFIENFLTNRESVTRKSSDFNSKAYSSQSTFNSTKGFSREKKYLYANQDEINSQHS
ncbi:hypothetical protein TTHERM_00494410 (macronuclear) [Tetrahymena thermophila SB210]|uniref:Uncharacterized protein n=1 Tax=Tetrahymena thermophila (strain SB210) TaxID=312017 RepID=I7MLS6_TETTS|nr:hypothetical protein TTHERM_00494410 [Tetrahymena thermophila SB210]EAS02986.2 hypothetical protein TTHERM_00494410 [Tetrahymena thermophila SB210]|eukprot:XP_001023231.2 hypothetical protein TTHERM_00494410 [Tetrahymena thermophila SB210]